MKTNAIMWQFDKASYHTKSAAITQARNKMRASKLNISDYVTETHSIRYTLDEADVRKMDSCEYYIANRIEVDKFS
jgi:hypothetical protein